MHQTADTSFPARRGLGFGLRLVRAVDFGVARLVGLDGGAFRRIDTGEVRVRNRLRPGVRW